MLTGRKLLLADDSPSTHKIVELTFGDEGVRVTSVSNGEQALEELEADAPDIVLADVFMPGYNGYELCERIKRDERFRRIPVLLLVGAFEPFNEEEARRVGADGVLTKPFQSIRELVSKVGSLVSGRGSPTPEAAPAAPTEERENDAATASVPETEREPFAAEERAGEFAAPAFAGPLSYDDPAADDQSIIAASPEEFAAGTERARATVRLTPDDLAETGLSFAAEEAPPGQDYEPSPLAFEPSAPPLAQDDMTVSSDQPEPHSFSAEDGVLSLSEQPESPAFSAQEEEAPPPTALASAPAGRLEQAEDADDALLDLGDFEPPAATAEADDFILDLAEDDTRQSAPPQSVSETDVLEDWGSAASSPEDVAEMSAPPASAEQADTSFQPDTAFAASASATAETETALAAAEPFVAEAADTEAGPFADSFAPVPLPADTPLAAEETAGTAQAGDVDAVTAPAPDTGELAAAQETPRAAAGGQQQVALSDLSPEAVDAIARRVVEQLSDRVVREIAWEVVPELAERLIKRRLEEDRRH